MARIRWTPPLADRSADLTIWWATLTDQEQLVLRREAWSLAYNPDLVEFLAVTECPLIAEPFDPAAHYVLTDPGRLLTFVHERSRVA